MKKLSYYEILEIKESATAEEIKASYRRLAIKYHPDRNPGNKEFEVKIKELNEAYGVLGNAAKKAEYDRQFKSNPFKGSYQGFDPMGNFEDMFEEIFKTNAKRANRGAFQVLAELTIEEFEAGANFKFTYNNKVYRTRIPAGMMEDTFLHHRLDTGEDVHIILKQKPHPHLERDFFDLYLKLPLTYGEVSNGLDVELTVLGKKISVSIPAGMKYGSLLRIKNQGLTDGEDNEKGDLFLKIVQKNSNLSKEDIKEILKMEKKSEPKDPDFISKKKLK